jgi:hypothetical protein
MTLPTPAQRAEALSRFVLIRKFGPEGAYRGAANELERLKFEAWVNELAERLKALPPAAQVKSRVLAEFGPTMNRFERADSEDRDRFLGYLEDLMDIFAIAGSDGLLNRWRYGFDPSESPAARNASAVAAMTPDERSLLSRLDGMTATSAASILREVLGPPSSSTGSMQIWLLSPDASSAISLASHGGGVIFSWMANDRFLYTRRL